MSGLSVHDYTLFGYEVDGHARRITLHTEAMHEPVVPRALDVVFYGVVAYQFVDDPLTSVLFDIVERPLAAAIDDHWRELAAGFARSGAPTFWDSERAIVLRHIEELSRDGARWFDLQSSYGLSGWVVGRTVEYFPR